MARSPPIRPVALNSIVRRHVKAADVTVASRKALKDAASAAYGKEPVLVHMYGDWCPHCVAMEGDMTQALSALMNNRVVTREQACTVTVLQIESAHLGDDGDGAGPTGPGDLLVDLRALGRPGGYPYIALIGRDAGVREFHGARTRAGLIDFFKDALTQEMQRCGQGEVEELSERERDAVRESDIPRTPIDASSPVVQQKKKAAPKARVKASPKARAKKAVAPAKPRAKKA